MSHSCLRMTVYSLSPSNETSSDIIQQGATVQGQTAIMNNERMNDYEG